MLVDVDDDSMDIIALKSLENSYEIILGDVKTFGETNDKKLPKALKRVIEYYGGSVDDE